jgi:hypothetical protein
MKTIKNEQFTYSNKCYPYKFLFSIVNKLKKKKKKKKKKITLLLNLD